MRPPNLNKYHEIISKELKSSVDLLSYIISHPLHIGFYRESLLINAIKKRMPQKYGLGRGIIFFNDKRASKEIDIIIYEKDEKPVLFRSDEFIIVTADSVKVIVEVKSKAKTDKFEEDIDRLCEVAEKTREYQSDLYGGLK